MDQIKEGLTDAASPEEIHERRISRRLLDLQAEAEARRQFRTLHDPPPSIPPALSLKDRLALPRQIVQYRIDRLLRTGHRVVLAAQFKAGKTTFVTNLVRSLVDGAPFLDKFQTWRVGVVTVMDFEMAVDEANQLDQWYERVNIKRQEAVRIHALRGRASSFNITDPEVRARWVKELRGTEFLVLDCLRPILDALGLDESHDAGKFFVALDALLTEAGIGEALVVHHMGHQQERSRGDSRLLDWPDVNWTLVRESEDPASKRFLKAYGRDVDVPETAISFNPQTNRLAIGHGSRRDMKAEEVVEAIVAFVKGSGTPPTQTAIRSAVRAEGFTDKPIRNAIKIALKRGVLVESPGSGNQKVYSIDPNVPF